MSAAQPSTTVTETGKVKGSQIGVIESDRNAKTRRVVIEFMSKHPKYGKYVKNRTSVQAHDETNESKVGDRVEIAPCRRMSKTKSWQIIRVVEAAPQD
jgi:small subunit ribosomal protein S17